MGNTEDKPSRELYFLQTPSVREQRKEIIETFEQRFSPVFLTLEEIVNRVKQSENDCRIIAEHTYKKQLEQSLAGFENAICSYIKIPPESREFVQGLRQAAQKFCSRKSEVTWKNIPPLVDIKFVDREVNSSSYQIFLNYMKNRKLSFQLFETISDYLISERKSKCSYIVVSSEYANFAFNTDSKVFCFCSRNDQIQKGVNNSPFTCSNNFTKIIKLILADKRKNHPQTDSMPVKTLIVWTENMDKNVIQEISRRKVKCRVIKVKDIDGIRTEAKKELYSTIVVDGRNEREIVEDQVESSILIGRVVIYCLRPNIEKSLLRIDHHLEYGYLLMPQRIKHLLFVGSNHFLEEVSSLACLLHQQNIGLQFLKEQEFQARPIYALAIVVSHDSLDRISKNLQKFGFNSVLLSVNADQPFYTLDPIQRVDILKTYVSKMCEYLKDKIYYILKDEEIDNRLNKIVKEISQIESQRCIFTDANFMKNESNEINFNLKLLKFSQTQTKLIEQHWHCTARMWKLNYHPLKNLKILQADIQKSLKTLVRQNLLNISYSELEKGYLQKLRKCVSFVSFVEAMRNLYMNRLELRLCLKNIMGSIDRYAEHQKIEAIKPLVALLICNFSALYCYPRLEPGLIKINMQRSRLNSFLHPNDIVVTNQFLQYIAPNTPEYISDNTSYIEIDFSESKWTPLSYYTNFACHFNRDTQTIMIPPYCRFRVTSVLENKKSTIIKLKWIETHNPLRKIIEQNTFRLDLSIPILEIFTSNSGLINYQEENQVLSRIHFYRFVWYMQEERFFEAENRLYRCIKKMPVSKVHPDFIVAAKLFLYLNMGRTNDAKNQQRKLINQIRKTKWEKELLEHERNVKQIMTNTIPENSLVVTGLTMKWEVRYLEDTDKFTLKNTKNEQTFSETYKPLFKNLNDYEKTAKKELRNIFQGTKKVYLQIPQEQKSVEQSNTPS